MLILNRPGSLDPGLPCFSAQMCLAPGVRRRVVRGLPAAAAVATTAVTAAATTEAAATGAGLAGAGLVDGEVAAADVGAVECLDRRLGAGGVSEFHETETAGAAGLTVHYESRRDNLSMLREDLAQLVL